MLSVYNYNDPINYISDYINLQRKVDPEFSIRKWSRTLGLKSTAPLLDILQRKKSLKGKLFEKLISELDIDKSELMYFQAINEMVQAKSDEKKVMYQLLMRELLPEKVNNFSTAREYDLDILSHWVYMAILTMANLDYFEFTAENIKNKLHENLELEVIEEVLFELFAAGLLKKNEDGSVERRYASHSTKTDVKHESAHLYLEQVLDLAKKASDMDLDLRELQCFSTAIPKENLPLAKEILRKTRRQIAALSEEGKRDSVYQVNLVMFPLTK